MQYTRRILPVSLSTKVAFIVIGEEIIVNEESREECEEREGVKIG